jgi:hypothetical protein
MKNDPYLATVDYAGEIESNAVLLLLSPQEVPTDAEYFALKFLGVSNVVFSKEHCDFSSLISGNVCECSVSDNHCHLYVDVCQSDVDFDFVSMKETDLLDSNGLPAKGLDVTEDIDEMPNSHLLFLLRNDSLLLIAQNSEREKCRSLIFEDVSSFMVNKKDENVLDGSNGLDIVSVKKENDRIFVTLSWPAKKRLLQFSFAFKRLFEVGL